MVSIKLAAVLLLAVAGCCSASTRFARDDNAVIDFSSHKVIRVHPANKQQIDVLKSLEQDFEMDYWNHPMENGHMLTTVDPQRFEFLQRLNRSSIKYEVVTHNYQSVVDRERMAMLRGRARDGFDYNNQYHTYDEIIAEIKRVAAANPGKAEYINVGTTFLKREIPGIRIGAAGKPAIFIECGIHAREWVSTAFGLWTINELLTNPTKAVYIENYQFIIVPTLNVDGYVFTHTSNRLWRKTRTTQTTTTCIGADPNRNWDSAFCQQGSSTNPCSETYCGRAAFSEPCSKAMADLIAKHKGNIAAYYAVHSYSQLWMYPFGYKNGNPPNVAKLNELSVAGVNAIKSVNGLAFKYGTIASTIYLASGSSIDWAYDNQGAKIAFALELRDTGKYGFQLPPEQIKPACEETWAGVKASIDRL